MKQKWKGRLLALLALVGALSMTAALAADAGSDGDPLVTLSYLNDTFLGEILQRVDQKIADRNQQLPKPDGGGTGGGTNQVFSVVTLSSGQKLMGSVGCEVLLRVGTASCIASSAPGLIDETSGAALAAGGALAPNHLYLMSVDGRGVKATSGTTKLLVRGSYTIS